MRALAIGGSDYVGGLLQRINAARPWADPIERKTLSHHLTHLQSSGLVTHRKRRRQHWYELAGERVQYEEKPGGAASLRILARGCALSVLIEIGATVPGRYGF